MMMMGRLALVAVVALANGQDLPDLVIPTMKIGVKRPIDMPLGGVGTWLYNASQTEDEVATALKFGARLVDTANMYGNQAAVASGIKKSGVPMSELFISTKVPGGLGKEGTIAAHDQNLKQLGVEKVDLVLTHFPCGFPTSPTSPPVNCSKEARQATWRGLEEIYHAGKARAIGVSHYCQKHLQDIMEIATVDIAVNQQEWHVGMGPDPEGVASFCSQHGIAFQSFSPLCGPCPAADHKALINGPLVNPIAKKYNISGAQVALRWLVQHNSPVIAKSSNIQHVHENLDIFHFKLTNEEMATLDAATAPPSAEPVSGDCKLNLTISV
jgi:diketogulonate reductase-like aldo/keto reductase